jgi:hypothetical protein
VGPYGGIYWYIAVKSIAELLFNVSHTMFAEKYAKAKHRAVKSLEQQAD